MKVKNYVIVMGPIFKNTYGQQNRSMAGKLVSLEKTYSHSMVLSNHNIISMGHMKWFEGLVLINRWLSQANSSSKVTGNRANF